VFAGIASICWPAALLALIMSVADQAIEDPLRGDDTNMDAVVFRLPIYL